jgi:colanic acid/amylovoran biosynthesis protein
MKILILHISNTLNYGSAMMAINLIYYLKQRQPDLQIYCECDEYNLNRLKIATGYNDLQSFSIKRTKSKNKIKAIFRHVFGDNNLISDLRSKFQAVIVLGGDDLSEIYQKGAILTGLFYYNINKHGCRIILLGQNIGPYSGFYKLLASLLFKKIAISTRDQNNFKYVKEKLKLKNILNARDLAFLPLPFLKESFENTKNTVLDNLYICVVPSGLFEHYGLDITHAINIWNQILEIIMMEFPDHQILLLGHVLAPQLSDDRQIILPLLEINKNNKRILPFIDIMQPAEARSILGGADYVFTGRMHPAVSTLSMGKIALSFAYSQKYFGVIGNSFDLPELLLDCRNGSILKSDFLDRVKQSILFIKTNREKIELKIKNRLENIIPQAYKNIDFVLENLNNDVVS